MPDTSITAPIRVLALSVRADFGGGPEHLWQLTRHLGPDVALTIACPPGDRPYAPRFRAVLGADNLLALPHRAFRLRALFGLAREIRRRDISLIHSHGKGAGLYGRLLGLLTGRPVVHTFHGLHVGDYSPLRRRAYFALERLLARMTRAAICVSEGEREALTAAALLPDRKLTLIENGVFVPEALPARPRRSDARLHLLAVSRFDHQKNSDYAVEIAAHLARARPGKIRLTILGEGEGRAALQDEITRRGLGAVVACPGPVRDPRALMREADLFLSTSRWEGMPLAVLEAMSEGLCPVVTRVIGNADLIDDGQTGALIALDAPDEAARAILALSPDDRARLGAAAYGRVARHHSSARMAARTLALYRDVLRPAAHPAPLTAPRGLRLPR